MLAHERYDKILDLLEKNGSVKVPKLTELFNVSVETIRRDLDNLEKKGHLKKVYGGAVLASHFDNETTFTNRKTERSSEKLELAEIAASVIKEGMSVALDAGTTNLVLAKVLKKKYKQLTILTNSLAIVNELVDMEDYKIILTGGVYNNKENSFIGNILENKINKLHIDTAFISVMGISLFEGLTDNDYESIQIQKQFIEISQNVIILADNSKFDNVCLLKIADFQDINMIITDSKLKEIIKEKYSRKGIEIINSK